MKQMSKVWKTQRN